MAQCAICGAELPKDAPAIDGKGTDSWRKLVPPSNPQRPSGIDYIFPNDDED